MTIWPVNSYLYRSDRPQRAEDIVQIRNLGIRTVINLEGGIIETLSGNCNWQSHMLLAAGIPTVRIEMNALFPPDHDDVEFALWVIRQDVYRPVLVHCKEGRDRTGFVVAAFRMVIDGWTYETAVREMRLHHFHEWYFYWLPALRKYEAKRTLK